jgi:hypothetical protein
MNKVPVAKNLSVKEEKSLHKKKKYVYPIRDWKEYLGESFLIVFSVLLAIGLTEYISKIHERETTKSILREIVIELKNNKKSLIELQEYNLRVLSKIDSALVDKTLQKKIVSNDEFHLEVIAPDGVLFRYPMRDAWTIAINNNIMSKTDIETISILSRVYEDLNKITKVEDEVARIIFDRTSRDRGKVHSTLILIKDSYRAWAVDRIPGLIMEIDSCVGKIEKSIGPGIK